MPEKQPTVQRLTYQPWLRLLDGAAGVARPLGLLGRLDADALREQAVKCAGGLTDFGDERFLVPMNKTLEVLEDAPITNVAHVYVRQSMLRALVNRLRIEDYIKRHPEVLEIEIERPMFVLGFPRTGTTLLQNVLSLDSDARALRMWELTNPVPVDPDREKDHARRRKWAERDLRVAYLATPEMETIHHIYADSVEECWYLFANTFAVLNFDLQSSLSDFGDWLMDFDMTWAYGEYKRMLQIHAHHQPTERFVLKCPEHLWFVDHLLAVFPDAQIVWTHREPVKTIASYCSLISLARRMMYGHIDRPAVGRHISRRFHLGVTRAMDSRRRLGSDNFIDLDFVELCNDPTGVVRTIKRNFGLPEDPGQQDKVDGWLNNSRSDKKGKHVYDTAVYGLDQDELLEHFDHYIEQFGIPVGHQRPPRRQAL